VILLDSYIKAEDIRKRVGRQRFVSSAARYILIGGAVLGIAYAADSCNAKERIDSAVSKARQGIEYLIDKI
jgi:hypothetical protein